MSTVAVRHGQKHPWAGQVVVLYPVGEHQFLAAGAKALVVDWLDRLAVPWKARQTEDTVLYATRVSNSQHHSGYPRALPDDNEAVYVKVFGEVGYVVHQTEMRRSKR